MSFEMQKETTWLVNQLEEEGISLPDLPKGSTEYRLPINMDLLSEQDLSHHMSVWASLYAHAKFAAAAASADEVVAFQKKRMYKAGEEAKIPSGAKVTVMKAKIESSDIFNELETAVVRASARHKLLFALCEGYDRKYQAVSREASMRRQEKWQSR